MYLNFHLLIFDIILMFNITVKAPLRTLQQIITAQPVPVFQISYLLMIVLF